MLYLVWYDADIRRSLSEKIQDARAAHMRRLGVDANLVLVNAADVTELAEIEVRAERTVQPHHFWVGRTDERNPDAGVSSDG